MDNIENLLSKNKLELDELEVPEALENKLRTALDGKNKKIRISRSFKIKAAAIFICLILIGYNFNTLGFYTEKLTGYDKLMDANLKKLNELGKGQTIGKSLTFKNGLTFTLDGIMLDDNKLLAFYTLRNHKGNIENASIDPALIDLKGKFRDYMSDSSYGNINDTRTEIKYISTFAPPYRFDKDLVLNIVSKKNNQSEAGKISFTLDKSKAMGHSTKKFLHKNIKTDDLNLRFEYICASPTTTLIKGKVENIIELAIDRVRGIKFSPSSLDIKLIADGKVIETQQAELASNIDGVTFKYNFEPLPNNFKKLQIQFSALTSEHIINKNFKLKKDKQNESINIEGKNIEIRKIYEANGNTYVTLASESDVILTKVTMLMDGKIVELNKTTPENTNKNSNINTRTLEFIGTGNNLELNVQRMLYRKNYNEVVDIISN
ncbi:DUF4179 domain-containing protein [Clostridium sp. OS1-26]|uniref:DUF4179 domain-containing protein n=1 Tax=Clostridium sp. OS1-26 TaxID=3070681 RepID=UPI0027E0172B|nr:DUF4179 domain-containing protein [Clostridium sp. OS1-26]WML37596.1 DUF4179 domain-containing protein [Clostridium sp. OS1-26]